MILQAPYVCMHCLTSIFLIWTVTLYVQLLILLLVLNMKCLPTFISFVIREYSFGNEAKLHACIAVHINIHSTDQRILIFALKLPICCLQREPNQLLKVWCKSHFQDAGASRLKTSFTLRHIQKQRKSKRSGNVELTS